MTLKVGKKCNWEDIEVNEVFAANGCWEVHCKMSETTVMKLSDDWIVFEDGRGSNYIGRILRRGMSCYSLYKLPQSVQKLWRTE